MAKKRQPVQSGFPVASTPEGVLYSTGEVVPQSPNLPKPAGSATFRGGGLSAGESESDTGTKSPFAEQPKAGPPGLSIIVADVKRKRPGLTGEKLIRAAQEEHKLGVARIAAAGGTGDFESVLRPEVAAKREALASQLESNVPGQVATAEGFSPVVGGAAGKLLNKSPLLSNIVESTFASIVGRHSPFGFNEFSIGTDQEIDAIFDTLNSDQANLINEKKLVMQGYADEMEFISKTDRMLEAISQAEEDIKQRSIYSGELTDRERQIAVVAELNQQRTRIINQRTAVANAIRQGKIGNLNPEESQALALEQAPEPFQF